jgi:hypothetical protein
MSLTSALSGAEAQREKRHDPSFLAKPRSVETRQMSPLPMLFVVRSRIRALASACAMALLLPVVAILISGICFEEVRSTGVFPEHLWLEAPGHCYEAAARGLPEDVRRPADHSSPGSRPATEAQQPQDRWCPPPPLQ